MLQRVQVPKIIVLELYSSSASTTYYIFDSKQSVCLSKPTQYTIHVCVSVYVVRSAIYKAGQWNVSC